MKFTFFRRHLRKAAVIETLLGTVGIPVNLAVAALMARVVQSALSGDTSAVLADGVWLAALLIGYRSVETLLRIRQERRRSKALHNCKLEFYDRFLSRPLPWLCACGSGEIKERLNDDFTNATDKLLSLYPSVIVGALTGVSYLLFVSRFSLAVSAVMVLLSILQGVPKLVLKARFERNYSETRDAEARLTDYLLEARHGFITLKLYDLKELYLKKLKKLHDGYVKIGKRSIYTGTSETVLTGFASVVVKYGMYAAVGIMVLKRIVSLGAGVEAVALAGSFFAATKTIFDSIPRFAEVGRAEARLGECLSDEDVGHSEIEGASVSLSDVSLQRGDKEILHRASVAFPTEGLCLIKGVNGAGKSTLLKLTVGLLRADEGDVRVGGAVPETISADSFPHGLFYLPQEDAALAVCPREFYGMVCGADVSAVMQLARAFGLGDAQLDGTNINTLSGGERKKVFLALALAAEPTILLMDEPTNSLDAASKTLLLSELKKRRGLSLIVTHDSIFDDICDRVYFAERGTVIEHEKDKLA